MKKLSVVLLLASCAAVTALRAQTYTYSTLSTAVYSPAGVALDSSGAIFVSRSMGSSIHKLSPSGAVLAQYGATNTHGFVDGTGEAARFATPTGLALDATGNLYVADTGNTSIRKITPDGVVSTVAGLAANRGATDGTGTAARFNSPFAVAVNAAGEVFVADTGNHTIRKISPTGVVTTFAGAPERPGSLDGTGGAARFSNPQGLAIDSAGNLFVADTNNHNIRRITPAGVVTTVAGLAGSHGSADGAPTHARFLYPQGIAADAAGNLFVGDTGYYTVRKISPAGVVTTIGGLAGSASYTAGIGSTARFYGPRALTLDASGNLYIADTSYLRLGVPSSQLAITVQPQTMTVALGSTARLSITATGAGPITYQWQKDGTAIAGATGSTLVLASATSASAATYTITVNNPVGTLASTGAVLSVVAAVPNDDFANATALTGASGTVSGSNNGATGEPEEPTHHYPATASSSIWYKWTAPETGTAVFAISSNFPTGQVAWTGTSLPALVRAASSSSRLVFRVQRGSTYFIAIGSANNSIRGNLTLGWHMILNDDFAQAELLSGNFGSVAGRNDGATREVSEPSTPNLISSSVWYRWTPTQSGTLLLDLASGLDAALYTGASLSNLQAVTPWLAYSPSIGGPSSRRAANVEAGTVYAIAVGSISYYSGALLFSWQINQSPVLISASGNRTVQPGTSVTLSATLMASFTPTYQWLRNGAPVAGATNATLTLSPVQVGDAGDYRLRVSGGAASYEFTIGTLNVLIPPANDDFVNAATLAGLTGSATGTNVNATGETGEPAHWNLSGTASAVWYNWTAPANGLAAIDTVGSNFDTVLAVYTGPASGTATLANLTRLTQDDDRGGGRTSLVSFAATFGTTYYIAVGGSGSSSGARGNLKLNWQLSVVLAVATPPASQTVALGGSATFSVTATGAGIAYQWKRNGTAIPGATNATLTVSNLASGADASFTVTVTNSSGSIDSAPATLTIAAPAFTTLAVRNVRSDGGLLWSIAGGGGTLVAVGSDGAILSSADNGRTWIPRFSGTTHWIVGVTYGAGTFVAVADRGLILLSLDGVTWTPVNSTGTAQRLNNVVFADGKFVAVGEGGTILTSTDANFWTPRVSGVTTWLHGLAYNAAVGQFATCGENGVILFSPDAITWTRLPVTGLSVHLEALVAVSSYAQFVAVGHNGTAVGIHRDSLVLKSGEPLVTWSGEITATGTTSHLVGLATGGGALFAAGSGGRIITATSDKGPWYSLPSAGDGILLGGLFHNDTLFLVGEKETVLQSDPIYHSRLRNISTRGPVGTGGNIMISGFIVRGSGPKQVLIRAAGPTLGSTFGLSGTLAAPVLKLLDQKGDTLASNTGWSTSPAATAIANTAARVGAFPFGATSADSALLATLNPGEYTVQVSGANNTTGLSIVEVYDTDVINNSGPQAVNISTRGVAGTGADKMIVGFILDGAAARRVLIRAVGPGLAAFGLTDTLAEPQVELYNGRGLLHASAGAWGLQPNADEVRGAFDSAGAFKLADGGKDSAMVVTLLPGNWTVQVSGANNGTGVAIIEVYALP